MTSLLYLAPVDWKSIRQRPQQLALRLARRFELTYVNAVGLRSARASDLGRVWRRVAGPSDGSPTFPLLDPRYIPWIGWPALDSLNRGWLVRQIEACRLFDPGPSILWIGAPSLLAEALLERTRPEVVVYDCMDHYAAFHRGRTRARIERAEQRIVERADVAFATSQGLLERLRSFSRRVELAPNGVDAARFAVRRSAEPPAWRRKLAGPVIGYHGMLGDWLDFPMLEWLAERRPEWSFVVIGPNGTRRSRRFLAKPNVHYVGPVPYAELPSHTIWFDVGLVPFEQTELTRCVHPIKALEYLAAGLPTVSTPLADLADVAGLVRFAEAPGEWLAAIEDCLEPQATTSESIAGRRQAVAGRTWDALGDAIAARLEAALAKRLVVPTSSGGRSKTRQLLSQ
jgi:glycosyltransferase involved in cell wall biosynthesis